MPDSQKNTSISKKNSSICTTFKQAINICQTDCEKITDQSKDDICHHINKSSQNLITQKGKQYKNKEIWALQNRKTASEHTTPI